MTEREVEPERVEASCVSAEPREPVNGVTRTMKDKAAKPPEWRTGEAATQL